MAIAPPTPDKYLHNIVWLENKDVLIEFFKVKILSSILLSLMIITFHSLMQDQQEAYLKQESGDDQQRVSQNGGPAKPRRGNFTLSLQGKDGFSQ